MTANLEHIRKACRWATYNGDCTHAVGEVKGPNTLGEELTVVSAVYDAATNKTRLGFAYGFVAEVSS